MFNVPSQSKVNFWIKIDPKIVGRIFYQSRFLVHMKESACVVFFSMLTRTSFYSSPKIPHFGLRQRQVKSGSAMVIHSHVCTHIIGKDDLTGTLAIPRMMMYSRSLSWMQKGL